MTPERALEKIQKCLALSNSGNANEAARALSQAQALMKKFAVTLDDVQNANVAEEVISLTRKNPDNVHLLLANACADAFESHVLFRKGFGQEKAAVLFFGFDYRPEVAVHAFAQILQQRKSAEKEFRRSDIYKSASAAERRRLQQSFAIGWASEVSAAVQIYGKTFRQSNEYKTLLLAVERKVGKVATRKTRSASYNVDAVRVGQAEGRKVTLCQGVRGQERARLH